RHCVLLVEHFDLIGVQLGVAVVDLHRTEQETVLFAELLLLLRNHVPVRQNLRTGRRRRNADHHGAYDGWERSSHLKGEVLEGYHDDRSASITSPSRKIDPATTMRGARSKATRSASPAPPATSTETPGAARRAAAASACGSADRGLVARVITIALTTGASARRMPSAFLSRIAANTSGRGSPSC